MRRYAAFAAAVIAAPALASPGERGWYVGADVAAMDVDAGRDYGMLFGSPQGTEPQVIVRVLPDTAKVHGVDVVGSAQVGYRFNRYLSVELAYSDFGSLVVAETYDAPPITHFPGVFETEISFEAAGPSLSLLGRMPIGARMEVFLRAGMQHAEQSMTRGLRAVLPGESGTEHTSDTVPIFGVGGTYELTNDWLARVEFQIVDDLHGSNKIDGISSLGPLQIRRYSLGLTYRF